MSTDSATPTLPPVPSVFLSYASEDRAPAQLLREQLPHFGLDVWYDESDLHGGDAWDHRIRAQIRDCDYFMPVISANTERRAEGYFRREWRLAVERSLDMADDHTFLLPVVIDETVQAGARVPDRFLSVQWLRVPGGRSTAALEQLCRRLASGEAIAVPGPRRPRYQPPVTGDRTDLVSRAYPTFPKQDSGTSPFYLRVIGWAFQSVWTFFQGFPKWVRILVYVWVAILLARACTWVESGHSTAVELEGLKHVPAVEVPQTPRPPPK